MAIINNVVTDQYGRPVAAAQVSIFDDQGALVDLADGNPIITDSVGAWQADLDGGTYELVITKGDDFISREQFVCGPTSIAEVRRIFDVQTLAIALQALVTAGFGSLTGVGLRDPFTNLVSPRGSIFATYSLV